MKGFIRFFFRKLLPALYLCIDFKKTAVLRGGCSMLYAAPGTICFAVRVFCF